MAVRQGCSRARHRPIFPREGCSCCRVMSAETASWFGLGSRGPVPCAPDSNMPENTPRLRSVVPYPMKKRMMGWGLVKSTISVVLLVVIALVVFFEGRKAYLDYQVRELCAKDGGVRVYEVIKIPNENFTKWGQVNFYRPTLGENALGSEYRFTWDLSFYKKGNPEISRLHIQVVRRADNKLLGEVVRYGRGGGDFPSPAHGSSFGCPDFDSGAENAVLGSIFSKSK